MANPVSAMFQGFNSFSGLPLNTAVQGTAQTNGISSTCYVKVCTNYSQISTAIGVSADASYSLGSTSVSAKVDYLNTLNITTYDVTVVAYASDILEDWSATNVQFISPVTGDMNTFCEQYGDSYVSRLQMGAEYMALWVFRMHSESDQTSISTALKAQVGTVFSATLQTSFDQYKETYNTAYEFSQQQYGMSQPYPQDVQGIEDFVTALPPAAAGNAVVISFSVLGYEHTGEMPADFDAVIANRQMLQGNSATPGLTANVATLVGIRNMANRILNAQRIYGYTDQQTITNVGQINQDLQTAANLIQQLGTSPATPVQAPIFASLALGTPVGNFLLTNGPLWGTQATSQHFYDVGVVDVYNGVTLKQLTLYYDNEIEGVGAQYTGNKSPVLYPPSGSSGSQQTFNFNTIAAPPEAIASVSGWSGYYVNQIQITTTTGRTFGPYPAAGDAAPGPDPIAWPSTNQPLPSGAVIVGLQGTYGDHLNQLGLIYLQVEDAIWTQSASQPSRAAAAVGSRATTTGS